MPQWQAVYLHGPSAIRPTIPLPAQTANESRSAAEAAHRPPPSKESPQARKGAVQDAAVRAAEGCPGQQFPPYRAKGRRRPAREHMVERQYTHPPTPRKPVPGVAGRRSRRAGTVAMPQDSRSREVGAWGEGGRENVAQSMRKIQPVTQHHGRRCRCIKAMKRRDGVHRRGQRTMSRRAVCQNECPPRRRQRRVHSAQSAEDSAQQRGVRVTRGCRRPQSPAAYAEKGGRKYAAHVARACAAHTQHEGPRRSLLKRLPSRAEAYSSPASALREDSG